MTAQWSTRKKLKELRRRFMDPVTAAAFGLGLRLAGWLGEGGADRLARLAAWAMRLASPQMRRTVRANLALAFPEKTREERQAIARASFYHMARNGIEFLRVMRAPERVAEWVDLDSIANSGLLPELAAAGQPGVAVMPHLGSWELLGLAGSFWGLRASAVAHPLRNGAIDARVTAARETHGLQIIPSDGAVAGLRQAARDGRILVLIMDQNTRTDEGGAFVDFFGLPVTMTRAPSVLARRLHLPLVAAACVREGGRYRMVTELISRDAREFASDQELLQELAHANERLIRAYPEQYIWCYKRWRYLPAQADKALQAKYPFYARPYDDRSR